MIFAVLNQDSMNLLQKLFGGGPKENLSEIVKNGAIIIDVRSPEEYHTGHIAASQNIPLQQLAQKAKNLQAKNKPVIAVCRSGARSSMAVTMLRNSGVEAYNGGAWNSFQAQIQ